MRSIDFGEMRQGMGPGELGVQVVFQPADELHDALGEALDALLENGESAAARFPVFLIAPGESSGFAFDLGLVADAGFAENPLSVS